MEEIWKDIQGYEGIYRISSLGRVVSLGNKFTKKEKMLKQLLRKEYPCVRLHKSHNVKYFSTHLLVWDHFADKSREGFVVDHFDNNKANPAYYNLQLLTFRENLIKYHKENKKSGLPVGVRKHHNKFQAFMQTGNKRKNLGVFLTAEEAQRAYDETRNI